MGDRAVAGLLLTMALVAWLSHLTRQVSTLRRDLATLIETVNQQGIGLGDLIESYAEDVEKVADRFEAIERTLA